MLVPSPSKVVHVCSHNPLHHPLSLGPRLQPWLHTYVAGGDQETAADA